MSKKMKNNKNKLRCSLSGRIINNSEEVVKVKYAVEYLQKQGYKIIRPQLIAVVYTMLSIFVILGAILLATPTVSAINFDDYYLLNNISQSSDGTSVYIGNDSNILAGVGNQFGDNVFSYELKYNNLIKINETYADLDGGANRYVKTTIEDKIIYTRGIYNKAVVRNFNLTYIATLEFSPSSWYDIEIDYINEEILFGSIWNRIYISDLNNYNYLRSQQVQPYTGSSSHIIYNVELTDKYLLYTGNYNNVVAIHNRTDYSLIKNISEESFVKDLNVNEDFFSVLTNDYIKFYDYDLNQLDKIFLNQTGAIALDVGTINNYSIVSLNNGTNKIFKDFTEIGSFNIGDTISSINLRNDEEIFLSSNTRIYFYKDIDLIEIFNPLENQTITEEETNFIFNINNVSGNIKNVSIIANNQTIYFDDSGTKTEYDLNIPLENGEYSYYINYYNDLNESVNSPTINFIVDYIINIFETGLNQTDVETGNNLTLLYSINDSYGMERCYYVYALTEYNITCGENKQTEFTALEDFNQITVYGIDNNGNTESQTLLFNEPKSIFYVDLDKESNVTLLVLLFIVGVLMFFLYAPLSAIIFIILGFILLFSEINIIISFIFIVIGVYISFTLERSDS